MNAGAANNSADWIYWGTTTGANAQDPTASDNTSWDANNGQCKDTSNNNSNAKPRNTCVAKGTCSPNNSFTSQSSCTSHGACSVGGNTSLNTCNQNGTCTVTGQTTQSGCTSAGTCSNTNYTTQSNCVNAGTCNISGKTSQSSCQSAHHCSVGTWSTQSQCTSHSGSWLAGVWTSTPFTWTAGAWTPAKFTPNTWTAFTWTPANHNTWTGCVMDRGYPDSPSSLLVGGVAQSGPDLTYNYDTNADAPDPVTPRWSSLYPAEQYGSCPRAVKPLSNDWSGMKSLVDAMSPAGNTNQAIGLQLGWASLVGGGPFPAPPPKDRLVSYTHDVIILHDRRPEYAEPLVPPIRLRSMPARRSRVPTSGPHTLTCTQSRSIPAAIQRRPCCKIARAPGKVLSADVGGSDDCDVQYDRHQSDQVARCSISAAPDSASQTKSPARLSRALHFKTLTRH